jgi:hypothetical protein
VSRCFQADLVRQVDQGDLVRQVDQGDLVRHSHNRKTKAERNIASLL